MKNIYYTFLFISLGLLFRCGEITDYPSMPLEETPAKTTTYQFEKPFPNLDVEPEKFMVNLSKDSIITIETKNKHKLQFASDCFRHKDGRPAVGEIEVQFRDFNSAAKILVSGIPMRTTDEDGNPINFQSAGMFEFNAFSNNRPLEIKEGKTVQVDLITTHPENDFDFYRLNDDGLDWTVKQTASNMNAPSPVDPVADTVELYPSKPTEPIPPQKTDPEKYSFDLRISKSNMEEYEHLQGVIWEFFADSTNCDPRKYEDFDSKNWNFVRLEKAGDDHYKMSLYDDKGGTFITYVSPTFQGILLKKAQDKFEEEFAQYAKKLREREQAMLAKAMSQDLFRTAQIGKMGIYNYDRQYHKPDAIFCSVNDIQMDDKSNSQMRENSYFLVTEEGTAVIKYFPAEKDEVCQLSNFAVVPSADNKLIAVSPKGEVYAFKQTDFDAIDWIRYKREPSNLLELNIQMAKIKVANVDDLESLIEAI